jgi:acyl-coenzyme A thioesterase PaaI-like protein
VNSWHGSRSQPPSARGLIDLTATESRSFLEDLDFEYRPAEGGLQGRLTLNDEMMAPGSTQAAIAVLASIADVMTGIPVSSRAERIDGFTVGLTVDLALRTFAPLRVGNYDVRSTVLKHGRTVSVTEAVVTGAGGTALAHCLATFMPTTLPGNARVRISPNRVGGGSLRAPFAEALGIRVDEDGVSTVERRPYTLQPAGTIQGGVVCALVEAAAQRALDSPIDELDVRFLATVRTGPGRATPSVIAPGTARVTVVDAGADPGRPTAIALARVTR